MQASETPLRVVISARVDDDSLDIAVVNFGAWLEPDPARSLGTGLKTLRIRFPLLIGPTACAEGEPSVRLAETIRRPAGCGKSLPPQDAAIGDPQKPRLFGVSPKWNKAMDGFFHGQLAALVPEEAAARIRAGKPIVHELPGGHGCPQSVSNASGRSAAMFCLPTGHPFSLTSSGGLGSLGLAAGDRRLANPENPEDKG
jgi:hypothetical protein